MVGAHLNTSIQEVEKRWISKFEASLDHRVSFRTTRCVSVMGMYTCVNVPVGPKGAGSPEVGGHRRL